MEIKIGLFNYKVIFVEDYIIDCDGNELIGQVDYINLIIKIYNKMPKIRQFTTLLHEVGHAICNQYNIDFDEVNNEERIVDIFSYGMTSFYLDNKDFIYTFIKGDGKNGFN